jgi:hypothetical protein
MGPSLCGGGMMTFDHGFHCFQLGRMFVDEPVERAQAWTMLSMTLVDSREDRLAAARVALSPAAS